MMSLSKISSAGSATKYYLDEEKNKQISSVELSLANTEQTQSSRGSDQQPNRESDAPPTNPSNAPDYYLKSVESKENTEWYGKLSEQTGLLGKPVSHSDLKDVLQGNLQGEAVHYQRANHKAGVDLTFSAPKSVSILGLIGGDARLVEAHNLAVKSALSEIEKDIAQVKGTAENGKTTYTNTEQMLFALVQHKTSREDEAHLHTHALASNLTRDEEGKLRSLATCLKQDGNVINGAFERLYNNQKYYTSLYQSHLAKAVTDMGYQIRGTGNGLFEIKGVPESVLSDNSTRSGQINDKSNELGLGSQSAKDLIAKSTRKAKSGFTAEDLQSKWQSKLNDQNFNAGAFIVGSYKNESNQKTEITQETKDSVLRAVNHLSEFSTSMSYEKLVTLAVTDFSKGEFINAQEAKSYLQELTNNGELIRLDKNGERFTTQEMVDREKKLVDSVSSRTTNMRSFANQNALKSHQLSTNNEKAIAGIIESKKQFNILNLPYSPEKAVKSLVHTYTESGKDVDIVSPNLASSERASENYKRESFGILESIKNYFRPNHTHTINDYLKSEKFGSGVLIVESANKLSATQLTDLSEKAKTDGRKVVFLNHESQTQSFKSHSALALIAQSGAHSEIFRSEKLSEATVTLREQDKDNLSRFYSSMLSSGERPQVVTTNIKDSNQLNTSIRDKLIADGHVSAQSIKINTLNPVFLSNSQRELSKHYNSTMTLREFNKSKGRSTYTDLKVVSKDNSNNTLTLSDSSGNQRVIDPSSQEFKEKNYSILKSSSIEVAKGDLLYANSNARALGLEQDHKYTVTAVTGKAVQLVDEKTNNKVRVPLSSEGVPLAYGYSTPSQKADPSGSRNVLYAKDYSVNKELISELTLNAKTLDVFTNDQDKAAKKIEESHIRPSAIQRVFDTQSIQRNVNEQTSETLKRDLSVVIDKLQLQDSRSHLEKAVDFSINHLSEREAAFTQQDLIYHSIRYLVQEAESPVKPEKIVEQLDKHKELLSSVYSDGTRWTTQQSLALETKILETLNDNKKTVEPYTTKDLANAFLSANDFLSKGQGNSVLMISTTPDRFVAVQGLAGTGKSTMLEKNVELINQVKQASGLDNVNVFGLAPTHAAKNELIAKGIPSETLSQLLSNIEKGTVTASDYKGSLFFVDEDSMIGNKQLSSFLDFVVAAESKAVFVGDREQLLSQSSGKPIELAIERGAIAYSNLTDIRRQNTPELLKAVHNIVDKQPESALEALKQQQAQSIVGTHVLSTKQDYTNDPAKNAQIAKEAVTQSVAKDYLSRSPDTRENTLVIAYTNRERDDISTLIRDGLQKNSELGKQEVMLGRFRQVNASREELSTMMPYKQGLVLATGKDTFYDIVSVDKESKIVTLKEFGNEDSKESYFFPTQRDHKFTNLFSYSEKPVSIGDRVMPRFTDTKKNVSANTEYRVSSIDPEKQTAVMTNKDGNSIAINQNDKRSLFWDYSYTRTADMAQGSTYTNVISAIIGKAYLTDIRRAYIDISRSVNHMQIYTDNDKAMMHSWTNNHSDKFSALQTIDKQDSPQHLYFNDRPTPADNYQYHDINGQLSLSKMKDTLLKDSSPYVESIAKSILGTENKSKSNRDYLVFGQGNSNTRVSLTGDFRGYYRDYETGKGGSIVSLLMDKENLSYRDALYQLDFMLREPEKNNIEPNVNYQKLELTIPENVQNNINTAVKIASNSEPVQGTLGERYLENSGVSTINSENVQFNNSVWTRETGKTYPALISKLSNDAKDITGIEIRYLNKDGELADLNVPVRVLGSRSESAIVINESDSNTTVITSDVIDGLKVSNITNDADIIATANMYDVAKLNSDNLKDNIILVLSETNDQNNNDLINKILEHFQEKTLDIISNSEIENKVQDLIDRNEEKTNKDKETLDDIALTNHDHELTKETNENIPTLDSIKSYDDMTIPVMPDKEKDIQQQDIDRDLDIEKEL